MLQMIFYLQHIQSRFHKAFQRFVANVANKTTKKEICLEHKVFL